MRLGCLAIIGALYLIWSGGQGLYAVVKNRTPAEIPCGDYEDVMPSQEWLRLTGCSLDVLDSSYMENNGRIVELFIPARGRGGREGDVIYVLVATKDETLLSVANRMMEIEDEAEAMRFYLENRGTLTATRDVEGLVRYGVDLDDDHREQLAGLDSTLAPNFVILDEGKKPRFGKSLGFLGGGLVILLITGGIAAGSEGQT
jgi:hypothetical protein